MNNDNYKFFSERLPDGSINYTVSRKLKSENDIFWFDRETDTVIINESDGKRYILHIGLFIIKIPYEYIEKNENNKEDIWYDIEKNIIEYILNDYYVSDEGFRGFLKQKDYDIKEIKDKIYDTQDELGNISERFCHYYYDLTEYFDTWALIKTNDDYSKINGVVLKQKGKEHKETVNW